MTDDTARDGALQASDRYRTLSERIKPEDYVESQPASPAKDPEMGRDTNRDFMLRYS